MNGVKHFFKRKAPRWCIGAAVLLAATLALPYWLYQQGSPILMEGLFFFLVAILASAALAMWTWGLGRYIGLTFMCLGVTLMAALHFSGMTFSNRLLLITLSFVFLGLVFHVGTQKKESDY
ncbi:MAG: hypothetical protein K6B13_03745 [Prevotella sp.]|nr:hypothetical protein [Prevotella sp.]